MPGSSDALVPVAAALDDALARGDATAVASLYAPDARLRSGAVEVIGRQQVTAQLMRWRDAYADVEVLPTRLVGDDRSVAWERIVVLTPRTVGAADTEAICATLVVRNDDGTIAEQVDVWSSDAVTT